jgi:NAD(P)-dependent dehydrogenase (short-subunit alcohol dehydrogenase family)
MSGELSGQVAIVTGGASGIGEAALLIPEEGATVIVTDIQEGKPGPARFMQARAAPGWKPLDRGISIWPNVSSGSTTAMAAVRPARLQYLRIADDFGAPRKSADVGHWTKPLAR